MRKIKFRAFIKNLKWVVPVEQINFNVETVEVDLSSGQGDTSEYNFDEIDLMQYTGLKGMNGVEIYEGDIVKYDRNVHPSVDSLLYVVEWGKNGYILNGRHNSFDDFNHCLIEVVGNIYENPVKE